MKTCAENPGSRGLQPVLARCFAPAAPRRADASASAPAPLQELGGWTPAEHLRVQRAIDERAHQFWRASGHDHNTWEHWLRAETEVLAEFCRQRAGLARS